MQIAEQYDFTKNQYDSLSEPVAEPTADGDFSATGLMDIFHRTFVRRASKKGMLVVFKQLALLVETGIDLAEALELVASSCSHPSLQTALESVHQNIRNGVSLSAAVDAQRDVLGYDIAASIQAGEASGKLTDVLRQIALQLEEELHMRSTIVGAMAYPAILCSAALVVAAILIWFVLPQFESSFESMGAQPPWFTEVLLEGAGVIRANVLLVVASAFGVGLAAVAVAIHPTAQRVFGDLCFISPILGTALRNLSVGNLFMQMGHLLGNGISLLEAIRLVRKSQASGAVNRLTETWEHDVLEGRGLTHSLSQFSFLPEGADAMLIMAERTGKLELVLATAGSYYRSEGSSQLRQALKLSEPLIIILLGIFVGVVVASVLLPILDIQTANAA